MGSIAPFVLAFSYNPRSELTNAQPDEATYTPYGTATAEGDVTQPLQWSSEYHDTELALIYYNYRYYNPVDGRWT